MMLDSMGFHRNLNNQGTNLLSSDRHFATNHGQRLEPVPKNLDENWTIEPTIPRILADCRTDR